MHSRTRGVLATLGMALLVLTCAGCSGSPADGAAEKVTVDRTASEATVPAGGTLVVDFGEINSSVGDDWVVLTEPDPEVLGPAQRSTEYLGEADSDGGSNTLALEFEALETGTTVIEFEYQFRGAVPEDQDDQKSARIEVTVEPHAEE